MIKIPTPHNETIEVRRNQSLVSIAVECAEGESETWLTPDNARKLGIELVMAADEMAKKKPPCST